MFEFEREIVEDLLKVNNDFRRLYTKHDQLKRKVEQVKNKKAVIDEYSLENIKKEKLLLKDKMDVLIEHHRHA